MSTTLSRVLVLVCATRPGALGPAIGAWFTGAVEARARELGVQLVPVSLAELALPFLDEEEHPSTGRYAHEHSRRWSELVAGADGFVVVTPEYNYGMPATLKNALDYLSGEWAWKPVGFVSYGNTSAGTRSVQHAKQVVSTLRLVPLGATVAIRLGDAVRDGALRADPARNAAAVDVLDELVRLAHALRPMRGYVAGTPGPLPGSYLSPLTQQEAGEVTVLQRCCWVDEAAANPGLRIDPLYETPEQVRDWLADWRTHGLWRDGRLLGMVRARRTDAEWHIGRLAVVPDLRGQGVGRWLLRAAEALAEPDCTHLVLYTGAGSTANIRLYESLGYVGTPTGHGGVRLGRPRVGATHRTLVGMAGVAAAERAGEVEFPG